jgi:tRNA pseudouridine55 synthase
MARRGEEVPEATKEVTVAEFARTGPIEEGRMPFRLSCSSGTYARALAHDLGAALGCGAHLAALRRAAIGPFRVEDAMPVGEIARRHEAGEPLGAAWLPLERIPLPFPEIVVDLQQERRLRSGQTVLAQGLAAQLGDWIRLSDRRGALVAVGTVADRVGAGAVVVVQPRIVFRPEADMVGSPRT